MIKYIRLKNLKVYASIGCLPSERKSRKFIWIDIELKVKKFFTNEKDDNIKNTIDYREIRNIANSLTEKRHFDLIESYADNLAKELSELPMVKKATVIVRKPEALPGKTIPEVQAVWEKED